jgi:tetratricopeptide (TPR) repeat protein
MIVLAAMLPFVINAGSRAGVEKQVAQLAQQAWMELFSPEVRRQVWSQAILGQQRRSSHQPSLTAALVAYDQALALDPDNQSLGLERAVVAVVLHLHAETDYAHAQTEQGAAEHAERVRALRGKLPPVTAKVAGRMLSRAGRGVARGIGAKQADIAKASTEDLKSLGLLAFLTGDFLSCERAWERLDPMTAGFSLVNAGLGILYQADGRSERAYPRLFHTVQAYPKASFLFVELADVALGMGDVQLAELWLSRAKDRHHYTYRRVQADLWRAKNMTEQATRAYMRLKREAPELPAPYYGLAQLDLSAGRSAGAEMRLLRAVRRWPKAARSRLALARLALQLGHLSVYLDQARYVLRENYGFTRSPGIQQDLVEILRSGGLQALYCCGLTRTGQPACTEPAGVPAQTLWSTHLGSIRQVEAAVRRLATFDRIGRGLYPLPPLGSPVRQPAAVWSWLGRTAIALPGLYQTVDPRLRVGLIAAALWARWNWPLARDWILPEILRVGEDARPAPLSGPAWTRKHPEKSPPPRADHVLAATHFGTVLFGGAGPDGILRNDTWHWDGITWTRAKTLVQPARRMRHAAAYDRSRQRLVVFGGSTTSISGFMDDTWEFDGDAWKRLSPKVGPKPRNDHAMAYDPVRKRVILFGGRDATGLLDDTWEWDGQAWRQLSVGKLGWARRDLCLAYDTSRRRLIGFGGYNGRGQPRNEVFECDGVSWQLQTPPTRAPRGSGTTMVYDERRAVLVEFSGRSQTVPQATWTWNGERWSHLELGPAPDNRSGHAMTYDFQRQRVVLFGGWNEGFRADTWEF